MAATNIQVRPAELSRTLTRGAGAGMIAAVGMAMFAMVASVTYQHHAFFTPLFHISALTGTPNAMMTSVQRAMGGHRFWFTPGAAAAGLVIHMMTGAAYGMVFALLTRTVASRRLALAGAGYGLAVFAVSSFVLLPLAATIAHSGDTITHMARMVGWSTFAVEHLLFGVVLGAVVSLTPNRQRTNAAQELPSRRRAAA